MKAFFLILALLVATASAAPPCCSTNLAPSAPLSDKSLYNVESIWTSDFGKKMELRQLQGKVQVLTMFFASCQYACPVLQHDMKKIESILLSAGITNVGFIMVTIDLERDTVENLHRYREQRQLDEKWLLLRGNSDDTLELGALLGVKFKKETTGQYAHSNVISILDQRGEIIHQQIGLNADSISTIEAIKKALKPPAGTHL